MKRSALVCLLLVLASVACASLAYGQLPDENAAARSCAAVADWKPPAAAVATDADRKEFAGEADCADWIYHLAGDEYDPVKARRCCLVKGDCNRELGIIFANGWGVKRDYDAATYFLCRAGHEDLAPFEWWGMIEHVGKMRRGETAADLTYCDHVTSGRGQLFCAQLEMARQDEKETPRVEAVKRAASSAAQAKLAALLTAALKYAEEEGGYEAGDARGGTAYPAMVVDAQRETYSAFVKALEKYSKSRAPGATAGGYADADRLLNRVYQRVLKGIAVCPTCSEDGGEEGRQSLREAQRAWIACRDAWAAYYAARWSGAAPAPTLEREILTALTKERIALLRRVRDEQ
jgi:uncharacterized protein YecT (DUF1311 family)